VFSIALGMVRQVGAVVTDFMLVAAFWLGAYSLSRHRRKFSWMAPRWYGAFFVAYVLGGVSAIFGALSSGLGLNYMEDLNGWAWLITALAIVFVFGMALALFTAWRGFRRSVRPLNFLLGAQATMLVFLVCCAYITAGRFIGIPIPFLMLPQPFQGVAFILLLPQAGLYAFTGRRTSKRANRSWMLMFVGHALAFCGTTVVYFLDQDCHGPSCMSRVLPWRRSCHWLETQPPGASCPLPENFNHLAVMHVFYIASILPTTRGLQGLLDCGWDAPKK